MPPYANGNTVTEMRNAPLNLKCKDPRVAHIIEMFVGTTLLDAHNLMCAMPILNTNPTLGPSQTFGRAAVVMLMLAIDAVSSGRYFDPKGNKPDKGNAERFKECINKFFPWQSVRAIDSDAEACGDNTTASELHERAAKNLYDNLRNPLVHSGGVVGCGTKEKSFPKLRIYDTYPGLNSFEENEKALCDYCNRELKGDVFLEFGQFEIKVHARPLYWAVRKLIEAFAADPDVQEDIALRMLAQSKCDTGLSASFGSSQVDCGGLTPGWPDTVQASNV